MHCCAGRHHCGAAQVTVPAGGHAADAVRGPTSRRQAGAAAAADPLSGHRYAAGRCGAPGRRPCTDKGRHAGEAAAAYDILADEGTSHLHLLIAMQIYVVSVVVAAILGSTLTTQLRSVKIS